MENRYGTLASWVYDLDKPVGRSFGDIEFYRERLSDCRGTILEPAVGNGRVLLPLLQAGLDVQGFDASCEMLERCQAHAQRMGLTVSLTRQRFESFVYPQAFAAIIVPAGSFQLLTDFAQAEGVLRRFHESLSPGGRLLLDLDSCGELIVSPGGVRTWMIADDEWLTLTEQPLDTDFIGQTTHCYLRYEHWLQGRSQACELERFSLRWWGVEEFALLLRQVGFCDVRVCGDYRYDSVPNRESRILSFEAWRPA